MLLKQRQREQEVLQKTLHHKATSELKDNVDHVLLQIHGLIIFYTFKKTNERPKKWLLEIVYWAHKHKLIYMKFGKHNTKVTKKKVSLDNKVIRIRFWCQSGTYSECGMRKPLIYLSKHFRIWTQLDVDGQKEKIRRINLIFFLIITINFQYFTITSYFTIVIIAIYRLFHELLW